MQNPIEFEHYVMNLLKNDEYLMLPCVLVDLHVLVSDHQLSLQSIDPIAKIEICI